MCDKGLKSKPDKHWEQAQKHIEEMQTKNAKDKCS